MVAAALNTPIYTMQTAGEGGAWGIGLLAAYSIQNQAMSLPEFLNKHVFNGTKGSVVEPKKEDVEGFNRWIEQYKTYFKKLYVS